MDSSLEDERPTWCPASIKSSRRKLDERLIASAAICFVLGGCSLGIADPQGPIASAEAKILINTFVVMLVIVVPTLIAIAVFAWWFRASNPRAHYMPDWAYSGRLEFIVWAIPVLVILFLGTIAWEGAHDLDPAKPLASDTKPIEVEVVSLDWKWLFIYPNEGVASVNQLVIPAAAPVHFSLTSASVMNVFYVAQLGSMIYTMNGMATQLNLLADQPGTYHGISAHFSGDGFPGMSFDVQAVPPQQYADWIRSARSASRALDTRSYGELEKQSLDVKPLIYSSVEPGLFQAIVTQKIAPAPGPQSGRPNPSVSPKSER